MIYTWIRVIDINSYLNGMNGYGYRKLHSVTPIAFETKDGKSTAIEYLVIWEKE